VTRADAWIVGVDLSTRQIDAAAIPAAPAPVDAPRLARRPIRNAKPLDPAARAVDAGLALRAAIVALDLGPRVAAIGIENPIGPFRGADRALLPILGALTMAAWPIPVAWYWPNEWREILGATGAASQTKPGGHARLEALYPDALEGLDEHGLDAFGVAVAHRRIIDHHHRKAGP
jgi:hypothetical protein